MTTIRPDLPSPGTPNYDMRVRETLQTYLGKQGDKLDRGLTLRDLLTAGLISLPTGYTTAHIGTAAVPLMAGPAAVTLYVMDLTPPPVPTGFAVSAAISNIFIKHDAPVFTQGHGYLRTNVYGSTYTTGALPVFSTAIPITQFSGQVFSHATNPATTWHLWITWESVDGVESRPAGGTNGQVVTTGQDVSLLLTALTGQIQQSQLFADLGTRINLIDGPASSAGTVAARVLAEAVARGTAIASESTTRQSADSSLASTLNSVSAVTNANVAAIQSEVTARTDADGAMATRVDAVVATATTDRGTAAAAIISEQTTRVDKDGALGVRIDTVSATVTTDRGITASLIQTEQNTRASADKTNADLIITVQSRLDTGDYAAVKVQSSTSASAVTGLSAQYTVKADVAGLVSGYGLASEAAVNAAPSSAFGVRANRFFLSPPTISGTTLPDSDVPNILYLGMTFYRTSDKLTFHLTKLIRANGTTGSIITSAWTASNQLGENSSLTPFVVQTTPTVINGVAVPPGVYIRDAFIQNGTITNAKIGFAAIDDANITSMSATKLTIGDGTVGGRLKSVNFSANDGWQLEPNGLATFNNAVVRGTIFASAGTFAGTVIAGGVELGADVGPGAGHSGLSLSTNNFEDIFLRRSDGVRFFRVNGSGANRITFDSSSGDLAIVTPRLNISGGNATFSGTLSAANGSFTGVLSGATGEFAGTLRAGVLDLSASQGISTTYGPGTYTVTVPSGRATMRITLLGAGGGGGAGQKQNSNHAGGGGGAGGIRRGTFLRSAGEQFTLVVGFGGSGGLMGNGNFGSNVYGNPGARGGDTILYGFANAGGGSGGSGAGQDSDYSLTPGGPGGAGDPTGSAGAPGGAQAEAGGNGGSSGIYGTGGAGGYNVAGSNGTGSGSGGGGGGFHQSGFDSDIRGGSGTGGGAVIEFFDANGVILRNEYVTLTSALQRQNIAIA